MIFGRFFLVDNNIISVLSGLTLSSKAVKAPKNSLTCNLSVSISGSSNYFDFGVQNCHRRTFGTVGCIVR